MPLTFTNGHALLIGVTESLTPAWALPDVAKDVAALHAVLTDPARCAYPQEHVRVVTGAAATRQGILDGLDWLRARLESDGNATGVIYFSGHGWRDVTQAAGGYYIIPYDVRPGAIQSRALRADDLAAEIEALHPQRLLAVLDCCHAGGMGVKDVAVPRTQPADGFTDAAPAPALLMARQQAGQKGPTEAGAPGALAAGRAVLTSSRGEQLSYVRRDGRMSIFTYHLIEALTGHAQPAAGATEVLVSDVMGHVSRRVPESARQDWNADQHPDFQVRGNFPIALLLGGKGLPAGGSAPDPLAALGGASGARSVQIDTGGGAFVGGNVHVGGDFIGRDQIIRGDDVGGEEVG